MPTPPQPRVWPQREGDQGALDYSYDCTGWLALTSGDTITSVEVSVAPSGDDELVASNVSAAAGVVTVWLSGGQMGRLYRVKIKVSTVGARTEEFPVMISVGLALADGPAPAPPDSGFSAPVTWTA